MTYRAIPYDGAYAVADGDHPAISPLTFPAALWLADLLNRKIVCIPDSRTSPAPAPQMRGEEAAATALTAAKTESMSQKPQGGAPLQMDATRREAAPDDSMSGEKGGEPAKSFSCTTSSAAGQKQ